MDTAREQIDFFLRKCDEVMQAKFIIADTKISELLKSIVTSDLLYAFFRDITKNFDYIGAKEKYLNYAPYGSSKGRRLLFPEDLAEKLAFIFCLLVDFDNKTLDLSDFLREYFYEDGSVYESFYAFCNQVIKPFKNVVSVLFRGGVIESGAMQSGAPLAENKRVGNGEGAQSGKFAALVRSERERVFASDLPDGQKVDALLLLNALSCAETLENGVVCGLLAGYKYFVSGSGWKSENVSALLAEAERRKEGL